MLYPSNTFVFLKIPSGLIFVIVPEAFHIYINQILILRLMDKTACYLNLMPWVLSSELILEGENWFLKIVLWLQDIFVAYTHHTTMQLKVPPLYCLFDQIKNIPKLFLIFPFNMYGNLSAILSFLFSLKFRKSQCMGRPSFVYLGSVGSHWIVSIHFKKILPCPNLILLCKHIFSIIS